MIARLSPHNWSFDRAAHLLVRAGFGGTPGQIDFLARQGMEAAVNSLLYAAPESVQSPAWAVPASLRTLQLEVRQTTDPEEKRELRKAKRKLRSRVDGAFHVGRGPLHRKTTSKNRLERSPVTGSILAPSPFVLRQISTIPR